MATMWMPWAVSLRVWQLAIRWILPHSSVPWSAKRTCGAAGLHRIGVEGGSARGERGRTLWENILSECGSTSADQGNVRPIEERYRTGGGQVDFSTSGQVGFSTSGQVGFSTSGQVQLPSSGQVRFSTAGAVAGRGRHTRAVGGWSRTCRRSCWTRRTRCSKAWWCFGVGEPENGCPVRATGTGQQPVGGWCRASGRIVRNPRIRPMLAICRC